MADYSCQRLQQVSSLPIDCRSMTVRDSQFPLNVDTSSFILATLDRGRHLLGRGGAGGIRARGGAVPAAALPLVRHAVVHAAAAAEVRQQHRLTARAYDLNCKAGAPGERREGERRVSVQPYREGLLVRRELEKEEGLSLSYSAAPDLLSKGVSFSFPSSPVSAP